MIKPTIKTANTQKNKSMKKLALILTLSGIVGISFGQGNVNFVNGAATDVSTNTTLNIFGNATGSGASGLTLGSTAAPSGYYYALLAQPYFGSGPTVATAISNLLTTGWTYTGALGVNALGAGRIAGGANTLTTAGMPVLSPQVWNQFLVVGWSSSLGTTWSTVSAELSSGIWNPLGGVFGISSVGTGLGATSPPEFIFTAAGAITTPFSLYSVAVIPEPTTLALVGLGGLSLLLFRRRK
jgi:hypothetical protein